MTVPRKTSIQAYQQIKNSGLLAKRRLEVYSWLFDHGPATASEIENGMKRRHANKRLSELRDQGVVEEVGQKICMVSGYEVILWDVTGLLPKPFKKSSQTKSSRLEAENRRLKGLLQQALDLIEHLKRTA